MLIVIIMIIIKIVLIIKIIFPKIKKSSNLQTIGRQIKNVTETLARTAHETFTHKHNITLIFIISLKFKKKKI